MNEQRHALGPSMEVEMDAAPSVTEVLARAKRAHASVCPVCNGTVLAPESMRAHIRDVHPEAILPNGETITEAVERLNAERASDPWIVGWNAGIRSVDMKPALRQSAEALVIAFRRFCVERYGSAPSVDDFAAILQAAGALAPESSEMAPDPHIAPARIGGHRRLSFDNGRHEDYQAVFVRHHNDEWDRILIARDDGSIAAYLADLINAAAASTAAQAVNPPAD